MRIVLLALYGLSRVLGRLRNRAEMTDQPSEFTLSHPSGLRIQKGLRESDVRATPGIRMRDMRNGYVWYYLPSAEIAGQSVAIGICFFKGQLNSLTVEVVGGAFGGDPWKDWSLEKEQARVEATRRWLADVGYPVGTYRWGVVHAELDPKSGGGGGMIRFR